VSTAERQISGFSVQSGESVLEVGKFSRPGGGLASSSRPLRGESYPIWLNRAVFHESSFEHQTSSFEIRMMSFEMQTAPSENQMKSSENQVVPFESHRMPFENQTMPF
jgi:hypothetical protein